jgi:hypothetical protein
MTRLFVALLVLPLTAQASEPPDRVVLLDGSVLQGRLSDLQPDDHLTLQLLSGESRTVPWTDLARVSGPSFADVPSVESLRAPPAPPLPPISDDKAAVTAAALAQLDLLASKPRPDLFAPALAAQRRHKSLLFMILSPVMLAAGTAYTAVGASQHESSMVGFRDAYVSVGSLMLAAGTATLIGGIVTLVREKRLPPRPSPL